MEQSIARRGQLLNSKAGLIDELKEGQAKRGKLITEKSTVIKELRAEAEKQRNELEEAREKFCFTYISDGVVGPSI